MNKVIIGMGSNIAPMLNINSALVLLARRYKLLRKSASFRTRPVKVSRPQPMFINMGCMFVTHQEQVQVVTILKEIESALGRTRGTSEMPRPIDLDLLVWNSRILDADVYKRIFLQCIIIELMPHCTLFLNPRRLSSLLGSNKKRA